MVVKRFPESANATVSILPNSFFSFKNFVAEFECRTSDEILCSRLTLRLLKLSSAIYLVTFTCLSS